MRNGPIHARGFALVLQVLAMMLACADQHGPSAGGRAGTSSWDAASADTSDANDCSDACDRAAHSDAGDAMDCPWDALNSRGCLPCDDARSCEAPSYRDNGDETVTSSCCGLVWQRVGSDGAEQPPPPPGLINEPVLLDWYEASRYCAALTIAGSGWRLPTISELATLIVPAATPTIDRAAFPTAMLVFVWSATLAQPADPSSEIWGVDFQSGECSPLNPAVSRSVRCVRTSPAK